MSIRGVGGQAPVPNERLKSLQRNWDEPTGDYKKDMETAKIVINNMIILNLSGLKDQEIDILKKLSVFLQKVQDKQALDHPGSDRQTDWFNGLVQTKMTIDSIIYSCSYTKNWSDKGKQAVHEDLQRALENLNSALKNWPG